jgi:hypothetical protein
MFGMLRNKTKGVFGEMWFETSMLAMIGALLAILKEIV